MAIDEHTRHELFLRLEHVLGAEEATTLMEHLPPVGWADVGTKKDLDHLRAATKSDIDHLRTDIESLRAATKSDIDHLRAATKSDIDHLRAATKSDIDHLRTDIESLQAATKTDIGHLAERFETRLEATEHKLIAMFRDELGTLRGEMSAQARTMLLTMSSLMISIAALAFTAPRLI